MSQKHTTVSIPRTLANNIKARIKKTRFNSISAYVTHVLEELEKEIEQIEAKNELEATKN
ncbi:MAG: CopG family transcriptional regulator [Candidatus Lokiarchaeota archaeon]|nr:CopG family transcriptional regulator [Candidatus Lokiarchaeota archaeon]